MTPVFHYPVTTSFYRGVFGRDFKRLNRPLKRACDWAPIKPKDVSQAKPTCEDCAAYKAALQRMGEVL